MWRASAAPRAGTVTDAAFRKGPGSAAQYFVLHRVRGTHADRPPHTEPAAPSQAKRCRVVASCYMSGMFPIRPLAARIVLDDRSRLPWRFFGRLTTAALTA
ncbi:hypothetical protein RPC_0226 [Rhodopseudomonas palustris BisB18]|uniref:Uncharacterized protein n=1 Tax=Rhodopseudomonas palustris (strain BisB18) TaxID=316056 RepID=Q21CT5_RHOPB